MNVVWFKRDLRIHDHAVLSSVAKHGPTVLLYILEPELWQQPDLSMRQYLFLLQSIQDLQAELRKHQHQLVIKVGNVCDILSDLHHNYNITALWSHQETWNNWTYQRDKAVKRWVEQNNIVWHQLLQNGVVRGKHDRNVWSKHWFNYMYQPLHIFPENLQTVRLSSSPMLSPASLGLIDDGCVDIQTGGRIAGLKLLDSFLSSRFEWYNKKMSSPVTSYNSCSRLSTHFAFGNLSIREVFNACLAKKQELLLSPMLLVNYKLRSLNAFMKRLIWHCHFIQKLEDEPSIEFSNLHPAYDGLRENNFNDTYFTAWKTGMTGYPMIDACMRSLIATGWLNFRMRAMLMSFASYHLWLHWRKPAVYLATLFTDYEPGIHYSQVQMQSGTTGINTIRIYNPLKQSIEHDQTGVFIKRWLPELQDVPLQQLHTPWEFSALTTNYPKPIVVEKNARKLAADQINKIRKSIEHRHQAKDIVAKHASRKYNKSSVSYQQGELFS